MAVILIQRLKIAAIVVCLLLFPFMTGEAIAQQTCTCQPWGNSCSIDPCYGPGGQPGKCTCTNGASTPASTPVPEMSDYLAMGFIAAAAGMIYFFRRRLEKTAA
jgi:hypothetical protein